MTNVEDGAAPVFNHFKNLPERLGTGSTASTGQPSPAARPDRATVDHPITAIAMATAAMAVAGRAMLNSIKKLRERTHQDGD